MYSSSASSRFATNPAVVGKDRRELGELAAELAGIADEVAIIAAGRAERVRRQICREVLAAAGLLPQG